MMPHPRTPPPVRFPRTTCRTPPQPPHFFTRHNAMPPSPPHQPSPHFALPKHTLFIRDITTTRAPIPSSPSPNSPRPTACPITSPNHRLPCRPSDRHSPCKRSPPSCPPPPDRSPPRNRQQNRYAIGHLDIYAVYQPQTGYRPLFSSVFRPAKEPEVLFFADYCYICQFQNWGVP